MRVLVFCVSLMVVACQGYKFNLYRVAPKTAPVRVFMDLKQAKAYALKHNAKIVRN